MNENNIAVRLFFSKTGRAKYISALDLITCFQRAIRRTDIPVWHTQGFNPHTYVNVNLPLSLGSEGTNESMDIKLTEQMSFDLICEKLNSVLPPDIRIIKAAFPVRKHTEIEKSVYSVNILCDFKKLESFMKSESIEVEKKTKKGITTLDIKPFTEIKDYEEGRFTLIMPSGCDFTLNPSLFFDAFEKYSGEEIQQLSIIRTGILIKDGLQFE